MPSLGEHDGHDFGLQTEDHEDDDVVDITDLQEQSTLENPVSRGPTTVNNAVASSSKPRSTTRSRRNSDADYLAPGTEGELAKSTSSNQPEMHQCPICGKTLETDNTGLNAHIDFCLSRGAILEAQAEASAKPPQKFTGWPKPDSSKKREETRQAGRLKGKPTSRGGNESR